MPDEHIDGPVLSRRERLAIVYRRLDQLPPANNAEQALEELARTLDEVEDQYSGVSKDPNARLNNRRRMYPPYEEHTDRHPDGSIEASTLGHFIDIAPDGTMTIRNRRTEEQEVVYHRPGAGLAARNTVGPELDKIQNLRAGDYPPGLAARSPEAQPEPRAGHRNPARDDRTPDR